MKRRNFFCILFLIFIVEGVYSQWNKLPYQTLASYPQTLSGGSTNAVVVFPKILRPVSDGHIIISSYYYNGSSSGYAIQNVIYETKDDFSSHRVLYNTTEAVVKFFVRDDSSFSWHAKDVGPYFSKYYNKFTLNGFQKLDTSFLCRSAMPPDAFGTCLTDHFIYTIVRGSFPSGGQDTLRVGKSPLSNLTNLSCSLLPLYNVPVGAMTYLNDSVLFFDCVYKNFPSKKVILKTNDFSQSWKPIYIDSLNSILSYKFTSENVGYVLLSNNTLMKTLDGGNIWTPLTIPTSTISCFGFFNDTIGYVGGANGFLSKTINGGQTWVNEISGTTYSLKEIFPFSNNVAYFKDSISDLYKNTAILISVHENTKTDLTFTVFPNPTNSTINIQSNQQKLGLISVYNVFGEVALELTVNENKATLNISALSSGIYFLKVNDNSVKILKN